MVLKTFKLYLRLLELIEMALLQTMEMNMILFYQHYVSTDYRNFSRMY